MRMSTVLTGMAAAVGALAIAMGAPSVAQAAPKPLVYLGGCASTDVSPTANACYGFFQKNADGGSAEMQNAQAAALAALGLSGPYTQLEHLEISSGNTIDFDHVLGGTTYISVHWGAGNGPLDTSGGVTGFYRLDLDPNAALGSLTTHWGSLSNAVLWATNPCVRDCDGGPGGFVPEPAAWAMMIVGFGGVGTVMRRRRRLGDALA